jgi:hypothetical protein
VHSFTDAQGGYALYLAQPERPEGMPIAGRERATIAGKAMTGTISIEDQQFTVSIGASEPPSTQRLAGPVLLRPGQPLPVTPPALPKQAPA